MTTTHTPPTPTGVARRPYSLTRLTVLALAAAAANALVFLIGSAAGASMRINSAGYSQITLLLSVLATLAPLLIAGIITKLIARKRPGFGRVAQWLGLGVALLSMVSPFIVAEDAATAFALAAMHVVVGAAWFFAGARSTRTTR